MRFAFALALLCLGAIAVSVPPLSGPLVDSAALLKPTERSRVEGLLAQLNQSHKVQMAILVAESLQGEEIEPFSIAVAQEWKLGRKGSDNGLLLVVAPAERKMRFEVGYGLEGELTDVQTRRILSDGIAPYFKKKRYEDGLSLAVMAVGQLLGIEVQTGRELHFANARGREQVIPVWIPILLFIFIAGTAIFFDGALRNARGSRSSGWDHWGRGGGGGGWGGGGFGGGGFSGGGGSFGGGGSSSSW